MTLLARAGVPGAVLWALLLISWYGMLARAMLTARTRADEQWSNLFLFIACYEAAILINATFDVALEGPMQGLWFWCLFGFGIGSVMVYRAQYSDGIGPWRDNGMGSKFDDTKDIMIGTLAICSLLIAAVAAFVGVNSSSCPLDAIAVEPGNSIQAAVDLSDEGAAFCLKKGIHRAQAVRPRAGQLFYGEGETVLNGSQLLDGFWREERYWVANSRLQRVPKHGECLPSAPACDQPQAVFIDDKPLTKVLNKEALASNEVYIDYAAGRVYLADDPTNHKVEATVASFAFESTASDVSISKLTIEKYGSPAQKGAIHAREGTRWIIENCVVRLNSGAGISVGTGTRVHDCDIHHNGQIGIEGNGNDILIEGNRIWSNNIYGFDPAWEAGGAKIA